MKSFIPIVQCIFRQCEQKRAGSDLFISPGHAVFDGFCIGNAIKIIKIESPFLDKFGVCRKIISFIPAKKIGKPVIGGGVKTDLRLSGLVLHLNVQFDLISWLINLAFMFRGDFNRNSIFTIL